MGRSIKDKNGDTALDLVHADDVVIHAMIRSAQADASLSRADIASGEYLLHLDSGFV